MKLPCSRQVLLQEEVPLCCVASSPAALAGQEAGHGVKGSVRLGGRVGQTANLQGKRLLLHLPGRSGGGEACQCCLTHPSAGAAPSAHGRP